MIRAGFLIVAIVAGLVCASSALAEHVHVYLIGGQSNGTGRGNAADIPSGSPLASPQTDVALYYRKTLTNAPNNTLPENQVIDLAPGSGHGRSLTFPLEFGPELSIGRTLADALPGQNVMLVKGTHGGSGLQAGWGEGGTNYVNFEQTVAAALQAVVNQGDTPVMMGMFWLQGESDANNVSSAGNYATNLTDLISRVRGDFFAGEDAPFVFTQLSDNQYTSLSTNITAVRDGQASVAANVVNTKMLVTDDDLLYTTRTDIIHFDANGQINIGTAMGEEMVALVPEPGSLGLLALGGCLLARQRRAWLA